MCIIGKLCTAEIPIITACAAFKVLRGPRGPRIFVWGLMGSCVDFLTVRVCDESNVTHFIQTLTCDWPDEDMAIFPHKCRKCDWRVSRLIHCTMEPHRNSRIEEVFLLTSNQFRSEQQRRRQWPYCFNSSSCEPLLGVILEQGRCPRTRTKL